MPVSEQTYQCVALEDSDGQWELDGGRLREKQGMSAAHNDVMAYLGVMLGAQLNRDEHRIRINAGRVRQSPHNYFIPDVCIVPTSLFEQLRGQPGRLESYSEPLPLVVEIWSPSTGDYDLVRKLPAYQRRGDLEIWFIHPFDRTVRIWRRQANDSYSETIIRNGHLELIALPGVTIDLDRLFD